MTGSWTKRCVVLVMAAMVMTGAAGTGMWGLGATAQGFSLFGDANKSGKAEAEQQPAAAEQQEWTAPRDDDPLTFSTFRDLAKREGPSVVNIQTQRILRGRGGAPFGGQGVNPWLEEFFGRDFFRYFGTPPGDSKIQSLGSGVIIDEDGYILTNNHVIEDVDDITVQLHNGKKYSAKVIGADPMTDLALIQAEGIEDFGVALLGDSDELQVGDWVTAIGNPFGYGHTVTVGVVSATSRVIGAGQYDDFIQTDASINPGNSGGPLFNIKGEVVGINTAIATNTGQSAGIGFAIPINMAREILSQLKVGKVVRGWLGVYIQQVTPELAEAMGLEKDAGAMVSKVEPGSPAEEAGIARGDVITEFNGKPVADQRELSRIVAMTAVGQKVKVVGIRDGKRKEFTVTIAQRPDESGVTAGVPNKEDLKLGLTIQDLTPELRRSLELETEHGVLVTTVEPGSAADRGGLVRGDIIVELVRGSKRTEITSVRDFRAAVSGIKPGDTIAFYILRQGAYLYLPLKVDKE